MTDGNDEPETEDPLLRGDQLRALLEERFAPRRLSKFQMDLLISDLEPIRATDVRISWRTHRTLRPRRVDANRRG